jgi:predicted ABC-type ATPase
MSGFVLILTGPPGSGKSTVADLLTRQSAVPSAHLHSDDFYAGYLRAGYIDPWLPEAHDQNIVVTKAIAEAAAIYAQGGYFTVLDGIVGPWFLSPFIDAAKRHGVALHYLVLYPDEATSVHRVMTRPGHGLRLEQPVRDLHKQFADLGPYAKHAIDSSTLLPAEVAAEAMVRIASRGFVIA